jgi:hypothetical protein
VNLVRPQHPSGSFGEEKNLLALTGFQPRTVQPAAVTLCHRSSKPYYTVLYYAHPAAAIRYFLPKGEMMELTVKEGVGQQKTFTLPYQEFIPVVYKQDSEIQKMRGPHHGG